MRHVYEIQDENSTSYGRLIVASTEMLNCNLQKERKCVKDELPTRKDIRFKYYDYSQRGMYFITICIKNRIQILGKIINNNHIELTNEGKIVEYYIKKIQLVYKNVIIDECIIMPNHIHMILIINNKNNVTISRIIKQYKICVSKKIGYSIWQKSFYEHIIRNKIEYDRIKQYVQNNIKNWKTEEYSMQGRLSIARLRRIFSNYILIFRKNQKCNVNNEKSETKTKNAI